jgi:outer membrane protein TolC
MRKKYFAISSTGRHLCLIAAVLAFSAMVRAQTEKPLTLEECYSLATQNYPLVKQRELIKKTKDYSVENAARGYLPQLTVSGQATYQSDVTQVDPKLDIPGIPIQSIIPKQKKDQYKIYAEATQTIYDGGNIKYRKQSSETAAAIDEQNLEVNLYALKDRINQLFFGTLLISEQLKQNELQRKDIRNGIDKTQALIDNGTAFRSSLDELKAELLKAEQGRLELQASRKAYLDMLGLFINQPLYETVMLEKPQPQTPADSVRRPELLLYDYQKRTYDIQDKLLKSAILPKLQFFAQGGYGRPTLNLFKTDFSFYYIGGLRLNWSLGDLYTYKNDKRLTAINRKTLDLQKETFLFNTNLNLRQQNTDISKYAALIGKDNDIVVLRESVKNAAAAQLSNGVITAHDYITQLNAEDQARQSLLLHQIQLLQAQYNYKTTSGN